MVTPPELPTPRDTVKTEKKQSAQQSRCVNTGGSGWTGGNPQNKAPHLTALHAPEHPAHIDEEDVHPSPDCGGHLPLLPDGEYALLRRFCPRGQLCLLRERPSCRSAQRLRYHPARYHHHTLPDRAALQYAPPPRLSRSTSTSRSMEKGSSPGFDLGSSLLILVFASLGIPQSRGVIAFPARSSVRPKRSDPLRASNRAAMLSACS